MGAPSLSCEAHPSHLGTPKPSVTGSVGGTRNLCRSLPVLPEDPQCPATPRACKASLVWLRLPPAAWVPPPAPSGAANEGEPWGASPAHLLPGPKASVGEDHGAGGGGPRLLASPWRVRLRLQQVPGVPQEDHHDRDVVV